MSYNGFYVYWGPPGTGKTWMLTQQTKKILAQYERNFSNTSPVSIFSLTRTAATEIAGRTAEVGMNRRQVGTTHSHAFKALDRPPVAESPKLVTIWNDTRPEYKLSSVASDVEDVVEVARGSVGEKLLAAYGVLRAKMRPRDLWPTPVLAFAKKWEDFKKEQGAVDFTDMIEQCLKHVPTAPGNPRVIIADEAQDMSQLEFELLRKWGKAAGALIIAGDPWQALYTWRGAHPEIFTDPEIPKDRIKVLSKSHRVPVKVHAMAMKWARNLSTFTEIEYAPTDVEGSIHKARCNYRTPERAINMAEELIDSGKSVMFMASCSYMLDNLVAALRKRGIPYANPWRTKRGDWNPLRESTGTTTRDRVLNFLAPDPDTFGDDARLWDVGQLASWLELVRSKGVLQHGAKTRVKEMLQAIRDSVDTDANAEYLIRQNILEFNDLLEVFDFESFERLYDFAGCYGDGAPGDNRITKGMLGWLNASMLADKKRVARFPINVALNKGPRALMERPKLYVGTIHSFKGSEADCVFLFPDLSPAGMKEWNGKDFARDSVVRAFYVALTRAREQIYICEPLGMARVDLWSSVA